VLVICCSRNEGFAVRDFFGNFLCLRRAGNKLYEHRKLPKVQRNKLPFKVAARLTADHPIMLVYMREGFYQVHDSFNQFLDPARVRQTRDEQTLQAQFVSRLAFVAQEVGDLRYSTQRAIIDRGLAIGNLGAACIYEAENNLTALANSEGSELQAIAQIASNYYARLGTQFVHPYLDATEETNQGFVNEVMERIANENIVLDTYGTIESIQLSLDSARYVLPGYRNNLTEARTTQTREMNYTKSTIFGILQFSLRYYTASINDILSALLECN